MNDIWKRIKVRLGIYQRRYVSDPLQSVPEFKGRVDPELQQRDGNSGLSYQVIADHLLFGVQYVVGAAVEGDIVEFGCMTGRTANVISAALSSFHADRKLHLFDSFEGLPAATSDVDATSVHVTEGTWRPGTCKGISPGALRKMCTKYLRDDQVIIYEGWFSQNVQRIPPGAKFSMVHVDCDLYQSTIDCLDHLFRHKMVSDGAIVLFDDWYCNRASNDHGERKAWAEMIAKYNIQTEDWGGYGWVGKKFIVHRYDGKL